MTIDVNGSNYTVTLKDSIWTRDPGPLSDILVSSVRRRCTSGHLNSWRLITLINRRTGYSLGHRTVTRDNSRINKPAPFPGSTSSVLRSQSVSAVSIRCYLRYDFDCSSRSFQVCDQDEEDDKQESRAKAKAKATCTYMLTYLRTSMSVT